MAEQVFKQCKIYIDGNDIGGKFNEVTVNRMADMVDRTAFGSSFRKRLAGLQSADISGGGFYDATSETSVDDVLFDEAGSSSVIVVTPGSSATGTAYFCDQFVGEYSHGGNIGEMHGFNFAGQADAALVRGKVAQIGTISASGDGTTLELGDNSTKKVWAAVQYVSLSRSTAEVSVEIQADSASGFATPTTVMSFTSAITANTASMASTALGSTDEWYRAIVVGGATSESFTGCIAIGVF